MLRHLTIQNFALIDHYALDFDSGMTVLTGETGAGKSILIDALSLVLGSRTDSKFIRHGADRCDISAEFHLHQLPHVTAWLKTHELQHDEDCLLRRTISSDGKSRAFINGQPVTVQQLSELGEFLIDIHGQHEHHFLLKRDHQLFLLDDFGQHPELLKQVQSIYAEWQALEKQKQHLNQLNQHQSQKEFLQFQLQELQELALSPDEVQMLEAEFKALSQSEDLLQRCQNTLSLLTENDPNLALLIQQAQQQLANLEHVSAQLANAVKNLTQAEISVEEAASDLHQHLAHFDASPEHLAEISARLDQIHRIARKHRAKPEQLFALYETLQQQYEACANAEEGLLKIEQAQKILLEKYQSAAHQLSKKRKAAAKKLSQAVSAEMQRLAMSGGEFSIEFHPSPENIHPKGLERCEFFVRPNPGQPAQALSKIASGGELSRISLAIQVILAAHTVVPTLIFDEVDVGIGGATASTVGQLLKKLSAHVQVLCVTHLPQVAAFGAHHYQVEKNVVNQKTHTQLNKLSQKTRQEEIARMLGGVSISPQSLAHAKELLTQAQNLD